MSVEWDALAARMRTCPACPELAATRTCVVVGEAAPAARLALVGEAPGADEDASGRPFVGRAGQLLDRLLAEVGLDRGGVAVLNTLKCRPPGNRPPKSAELANCRPYLQAQLSLLAPALVVALGRTAAAWFLGRSVTLSAARGAPHPVPVGGLTLPVLVTYHPSAAIRFGPAGAPLAGLREDLGLAAALLAEADR